jgi:hypothetical protein
MEREREVALSQWTVYDFIVVDAPDAACIREWPGQNRSQQR